MRNLKLLVASVAMFSLLLVAGCGDDDGGNPTTETNCTDGVDNDQDGVTDCLDSDCAAHPDCQSCGNGLCEPAQGETATTCPADCGSTCGDGTCDAGENNTNCPADCPADPFCGDGTCDAGEDATSCPADCTAGETCEAVVDLLEQNGCPDQSCTIVDQNGTIGCGPTGTNANYADCSNGQGCLAGSLCAGDGTVSTCMPFCDLQDPTFVCPDNGICMFQINTSGGPAGLCGLGDDCDPLAQTGCTGSDACYFLSGGNTICVAAGTGAAGDTCQYIDDCSPGMACMGNPGACTQLCDPNVSCTTGTCQGQGTIPNWPDVGFCQ